MLKELLRCCVCICALLVQQQAFAQLAGGTYTINSAQATIGTNFHSFTDAATALNAGITGPVIINVAPTSGPYNETFIINSIPGSSSVNTITINGNAETLTYTATTLANSSTVLMNGANHVTLNNLRIIAAGTSFGIGVAFSNGAANDSVKYCNISIVSTTNDPGGISIDGSSIVILNDTISGGRTGITSGGTASSPLTNLQIIGNIIKDFRWIGLEIGYSSNAVIAGNDISRTTRTNVDFLVGIRLNGGGQATKIDGNKIHDSHTAATNKQSEAYGILIGNGVAGQENIISNNLIYNFNNDGPDQAGLCNNGSHNRFYHNTVVLDGNANTIKRGYYDQSSSPNSNVYISNNIFYLINGGSKFCLEFLAAPAISVTSDYNDFYISGTGTASQQHISKMGTINNYSTLSAWQGLGFDASSHVLDPMFTSPSTWDFTPTNQAMDNMGFYVGVNKDITGSNRSTSNPDIGAYEFISAPCITPPVAGVIQAPAVICAGANVTFSLSGNSMGSGQTYVWESAPSLNGPFTSVNISNFNYFFTTQMNTTAYYRCAVTCSGMTSYSNTVLITAAPALPGGTYTINSGAPTGGTNFNSFSDAVAALNCGIAGSVIFNVVPGAPYSERLVLDSIAGTSASSTITFNGNGATLSYTATVSADRSTILLNGADYVTFNDLNIQASGTTYGWGVHLTKGADNDTIKNCTITVASTSNTTSNTAGIVASGSATSVTSAGNSDNIVILDNSLSGAYQSIILTGSSSSKLFNNKIINNTIKDFYSDGIILTYNTNPLVTANDIKRDTRTSTATTLTGIELGAGNAMAKVDGNRIHDTHNATTVQTGAAYGINLNSCDAPVGQENIISNNLIFNFNSGSGIQNGLRNTGSDGTYFYHNTVVFDNAASTGGAAYAFYQTTAAANIKINNNIFYITRGGTGAKHCLYFNAITSSIVSNNNDLYINAPAGTNYIGYYNGNQSTLTNWQAVNSSAYDQQSVSLDPLFAATLTSDYTPTNLLLDNAGLPVGISRDILNSLRSGTTPDVGCYEFLTVPSPLAVKLVAFAAEKKGQNVLLSWSVSQEEGLAEYIVERSLDGRSFSEAGKTNAEGKAMYNFTDRNVVSTTTNNKLCYRLKMIASNGKTSYSNVAIVNLDASVEFFSAYPNPFIESINIMATATSSGKCTITIRNINGRIVVTQSTELSIGSNQIKINGLDKLAQGIYKIFADINGEIETVTLMK